MWNVRLFRRRWSGHTGKTLGPEGVAAGPDGSIYIADTGNHRVRRVGPNGRIATVAVADLAVNHAIMARPRRRNSRILPGLLLGEMGRYILRIARITRFERSSPVGESLPWQETDSWLFRGWWHGHAAQLGDISKGLLWGPMGVYLLRMARITGFDASAPKG